MPDRPRVPARRTTVPPAVRRRTPSVDVGSDLLGAALEILAAQGPQALTVRSVAAQAGVAPAGVYSRYDGMPGLLDALLVQGFDRLHDCLAAARGLNAPARLAEACTAYRAFAIENPHHYQLMFDRPRVAAMSAQAHVSARRAFTELVDRVADATAAGGLRSAAAVETAQVIWSALHGAVSFELNGICFVDDPAATYAELVAALLRGLGPDAKQ